MRTIDLMTTTPNTDWIAKRLEALRDEWRDALDKLEECGWRATEVRAAAGAAARVAGLLARRELGEFRAAFLRDAAQEGRTISTPEVRAWRGQRLTWDSRLEQLEADPALRRCLWIVCEELNAGTPEVLERLELLDGVH